MVVLLTAHKNNFIFDIYSIFTFKNLDKGTHVVYFFKVRGDREQSLLHFIR